MRFGSEYGALSFQLSFLRYEIVFFPVKSMEKT